MESNPLLPYLSDLALGGVRYFDTIDSTNIEAGRWVHAGAPDLALVAADEQTAGRGRNRRQWFTPAGAALAFSVILRPEPEPLLPSPVSLSQAALILRLTALGALSVCEALADLYGLSAQIKWPNDVLLDRRKTCGVLVEAIWQGNHLEAAILGIGINVASSSLPPDEAVIYPVTCVEARLGKPIERYELLRGVLLRLITWRKRLEAPDFLRTWDHFLAFKGEWVQIINDQDSQNPQAQPVLVLGLDELGRLRLQNLSGDVFSLLTGELRLRPTDWAQPKTPPPA